MVAAREAWESAGLAPGDAPGTALVSATTVGGMDRSETAFARGDHPVTYLASHPCGDSTDRIAAFLGLSGYRTTLSTACSSGANAIIHAARLIGSGRAHRVIAGGVDALSRFTLNGFNSLMILDKELCQPYDRNRRGLNLGEGAGFLVLESEYMVQRRNAPLLCRLSGFANTNDAYHQTASSPDGEAAFQAMRQALAMGRLQAGEVDYINVHGTGTENNDASEGKALLRLFGDTLPPFSSTKSFTGHTLGAAAGVEAVYSVLSIREGMIPPSLGFFEAMEDPAVSPETRYREGLDIARVLSNSFGFGGNNSSLLFTRN
jgi:3-oxoacyl-[acyl-carrier-protein] synthase-1